MLKHCFFVLEFTLRELEILRGINAECATTVHDALLCFDKMINGEICAGHKIDDLKETFKYISILKFNTNDF